MLRHDADHRGRVRLVALERPHPARDLGRLAIRAACHQPRDRSCVSAPLVGVVRKPTRHQQSTEVCVAQPQLTERLGVPLDLRRRIRGVADRDLLREEHDVGRVREGLDVELAVLAANFIRFSEARLQALSSIDMYSEHGFDALMRLVFGSVCQLLIVVSYCTPGSAHCQAASAMSFRILRALTVSTTAPSVRAVRFQSPSASTASMNASLTRTELFAFWYWIDAQSGESSDMS